MFKYLNIISWTIFSLMSSGLHAKVIDMQISPKSVGECKNGLVKDVDSFFINATVKLEREVKTSDFVIFEIAKQPNNEFTHYFDINLKYKCNGKSLKDETLYCKETEPNVYSISKTERATDNLKGAKIRGFITGRDGNKYCEEKTVPNIFNVFAHQPELIINDQKFLIEEWMKYINTTIQGSSLSLDFTLKTSAEPCDITLRRNELPIQYTKGIHASYKHSIKDDSELLIVITYSDCSMSGRNRSITCLIKAVLNETLSLTHIFKTTTEMEIEVNKTQLNTMIQTGEIIGIVIGASLLVILILSLTSYYLKKKKRKRGEGIDIKKDELGQHDKEILSCSASSKPLITDKFYSNDTIENGENTNFRGEKV